MDHAANRTAGTAGRLATVAAVAALGLATVTGTAVGQEDDDTATRAPTVTVVVEIEPIEPTTYVPVRNVHSVVVGRQLPPSEANEVAPDDAEEAERSLAELGARRTPDGLVVTLPETILFDFDSAALTGDAADEIAALVEVLDHYADVDVEVAGHTDSRGEDDYNQMLSEQRAQAVLDALVAGGASSSQLTAVGYGASRPVAPNETGDGQDDPEGRERNRRVEVILRES